MQHLLVSSVRAFCNYLTFLQNIASWSLNSVKLHLSCWLFVLLEILGLSNKMSPRRVKTELRNKKPLWRTKICCQVRDNKSYLNSENWQNHSALPIRWSFLKVGAFWCTQNFWGAPLSQGSKQAVTPHGAAAPSKRCFPDESIVRKGSEHRLQIPSFITTCSRPARSFHVPVQGGIVQFWALSLQ